MDEYLESRDVGFPEEFKDLGFVLIYTKPNGHWAVITTIASVWPDVVIIHENLTDKKLIKTGKKALRKYMLKQSDVGRFMHSTPEDLKRFTDYLVEQECLFKIYAVMLCDNYENVIIKVLTNLRGKVNNRVTGIIVKQAHANRS